MTKLVSLKSLDRLAATGQAHTLECMSMVGGNHCAHFTFFLRHSPAYLVYILTFTTELNRVHISLSSRSDF